MSGLIIPVNGLSAGRHHFNFDVGDSFFSAVDGSLVKSGNAEVDIQAEKGIGGMTLDFRIDGQVDVECDRCLELLSLPVEYDGRLEVRVGEGDYDGDVMWVGEGEDADLAQYVYESICLSLPLSRIHGQDAQGRSLCDPDMLARFKVVTEKEFDDMAEAAGKRDGGLAENEELRKLKEGLE